MISFKKLHLLSGILLVTFACKNKENTPVPEETAPVIAAASETETFRPRFHFTPPKNWMNDPNGLVYHQGIYHLFYQHHPDGMRWGPMHWGHATSADLIHWEHKPIALSPDDHGYIFSGSVVADTSNTSGFGTGGTPPLVAIFTYHDPKGEKEKKKDFQTQGIAYSLDNGESWTKYGGNPVIGNEGLKDFRDPKVFWDAKGQKWVMALVAGDHVQFWRSQDLRSWTKMSTFGHRQGAHGGVWECPDLFKLTVPGSDEEKWVLLVSVNPGGPNGGSGTQYFVGDFDGERFRSDQREAQWLDHGTDNYAGVTYNNTPDNERILIGWMSNWDYAQDTPTTNWRSAMTLPRILSLKKVGERYLLHNKPIPNFDQLVQVGETADRNLAVGAIDTLKMESLNHTEIRFTTDSRDFVLNFRNTANEELVLTMAGNQQLFLLDRVVSGKRDFNEKFANTLQQMPVGDLPLGAYEVRIILDRSSMEVFINEGQYVMTALLFPNEPYSRLLIENTGAGNLELRNFGLWPIKGIQEVNK